MQPPEKPVTADPGKRNPETPEADTLKSPVLAATPKPPSTSTTVSPKAPTPVATPGQKPASAEGASTASQVRTPEAPRSPTTARLPKQSIAAAAMAKLQTRGGSQHAKIFTQSSPKPPEKAVTVEKTLMPASETVNATFA